jgi:hypothetical protein
MFISTRFLSDRLGIDKDIAAFFVDREVPAGNRYWKDRLLYISRGNGFLFIPVVYDFLFKLGLSKEALFESGQVERMEAILHSAGKVEYDLMAGTEHIKECYTIMEGHVVNKWLWNALDKYFTQNHGAPTQDLGLPLLPLNRADTFLFSICDLNLDEGATRNFLTYWYALMSSFLMMDDVVDYDDDLKKGEENAVTFLGEGKEALLKAIEILRRDFNTLSNLNPSLGAHFRGILDKEMEGGSIKLFIDSKESIK